MYTDEVNNSELFDLLTKATRDAVWHWDLEADTIWWNEGYSTLFGYSPQEAAEDGLESWSRHVHPVDKERVLTSIHQVVEQGLTNWSDEYRFGRADGTWATVLDRGYVLHREGRPIRMVGSMQDISERIALQQAHQEGEERLRFALDSAQLGTWELDPVRGIVTWDERCQALCGLKNQPTQLFGLTVDYIHAEDKERVEQAVAWALKPESGGSYDMRFRTVDVTDGRIRWVRFMGQTYFTEKGEAYRFSGVAQDITEEVLNKEKTALAEQQARLALEGSGSGSFYINVVTGHVLYSPSFARILTGEERTDYNWEIFIEHLYPEDRPIRDQAHAAALQTGDISYESRFVWTDGTIHWVKVQGQYLFDVEHKPVSVTGIVLDITRQKQKDKALLEAEAKLRVSELRFRNMILQAPVAISMLHSRELIIETANGSMLEIWRRDASIIGLPLIQALPELEGQGFIELLQMVIDTGVTHYGFERAALLKRRGQNELEEAYFNFVYAPVRDNGEQVSGVMVVATEVTVQVKAKIDLQESEQRFRNLIEEAPVAISLFVGPDMVVELPNEAMLKFWGKGNAVIGKPLRQALPELVGQPFLDILDKVFTTGIEYSDLEAKADLVVDGQLQSYYFNFTYKPLRNAAGQVYAILDMATDVTEQVVARRAIEENERRFRTLLETISHMTWTNTPGGEVNFYNQRWYNYTGLDFEQTKAWGWQAVIHPDDLPDTLEKFGKALADGTIFVVENRYKRGADGMYRWHLNRALPIRDEAGDITVWVGTATDIHEQKQLAAELEKLVQARTEQLVASNHDLRRSNENLEKFAYVASHDLQEPLRKIQSFGDLLKSQYAEQLGDGLGHLERMQLAANRMSLLIKDLLTFSRISTRQEAARSVALNQVVLGVLGDLEVAIQQADARIEVGTLPTIKGDELQLRQLFQNLLSNALKFQKPGAVPLIQVKAGQVAANELPSVVQPSRRADVYHCISVSDNGIGFEEKYIDRIFQVFQRLHGRSEYTGTGIGLAICEKVAANHGGAISAVSQPGQGATFTVYLPVS